MQAAMYELRGSSARTSSRLVSLRDTTLQERQDSAPKTDTDAIRVCVSTGSGSRDPMHMPPLNGLGELDDWHRPHTTMAND